MKLLTLKAATATLCIAAATAAASGTEITPDDCPANYPTVLDAELKICTQEECEILDCADEDKVTPPLMKWERGIQVQPCDQCRDAGSAENGGSVLPDDSSVIVDSEDDIIREDVDDINNDEQDDDTTSAPTSAPTFAPTFVPTFSPTFSPTAAPTSSAGALFGSFSYVTAGLALAFTWSRS